VNEILKYLMEHKQEMIQDLKSFVERESPSTDKTLLDSFSEFLVDYATTTTGASAEVISTPDHGNHVRFQWGNFSGQRPILLLAHFDTVWSSGTIEQMPCVIENEKITGPGVFDMKGGLVQGLWAIKALRTVTDSQRPIVLLCTSDEEIGSPSSRKLIEGEAKRASAVLVLEPSLDGALKTARKGVSNFSIEVTGKAAHAGLNPDLGISAIDELSRIVQILHAQSNRETGTTVNVGIISGGSRSNIIAPEAYAQVDTRSITRSEAERMVAFIQNLQPYHPEARIKVSGGINRLPMECTDQVTKLFQSARSLANEMGFDVDQAMAGGGSDGSFCAALNVPVLDGLGAVGGGAHATDEYLDLSKMVYRAALVGRMIETI
jgi:glutamate carboxypeptidase